MKNLYAFILMTAIVLSGCGKKGGGLGITQSTASFQPTTAASQWTYQVNESFNPSSSLLLVAAEAELNETFPSFDTSFMATMTALSKDTVIGGLQYSILSQDSITNFNNIYLSVQDSIYWGVGIVPDFQLAGVGGIGSLQPIIYLKDEPAGTTWTQTVIDPGVNPGTFDTTVYTTTINSINGSMLVGGTTYNNVTAETVKILPGGLTSLAAGVQGLPPGLDLSLSGNYYFARGIGLIEINVNSSLYGFQYTETLTSYNIVK